MAVPLVNSMMPRSHAPTHASDSALTAPLVADMGRSELEAVEGVTVVQLAQWGELAAQIAGLPLEMQNKYAVAALPAGAKVATELPAPWRPPLHELHAGEPLLYVAEESSAGLRCLLACCGGLNLRALRLHFYEHGRERYRVERPCKMGGGCCCPLEMALLDSATARTLGVVREDWDNYCGRCADSCCRCTFYHKVLRVHPGAQPGAAGLEQRYSLRANVACCGRVNNCCGATCCKNDQVFDVLDLQGNIVATIQKTYAPTPANCWSACCRMNGRFSNFIMSFPPDASEEERALLLAALFQIDYQLFEKQGGNNDG